MFRRILVGFDGSDGARRAARIAVALASDVAGEAKILVVIPPPASETDEDRRHAFDAEAGPLRRMVEQELTLTEHAHASTSIDVVSDARPAQFLERYALEHGYDLIVIGRHGREGGSHPGLGRVAHELAGRDSIPVLLT